LPGLAISRSIGDYLAHTTGVIAEPEIIEYQLQPQDLIIVVGSDGLFQFLSNETIADIVAPYYNKD
jgi:serine/threonine protein phosphatase PrpC